MSPLMGLLSPFNSDVLNVLRTRACSHARKRPSRYAEKFGHCSDRLPLLKHSGRFRSPEFVQLWLAAELDPSGLGRFSTRGSALADKGTFEFGYP